MADAVNPPLVASLWPARGHSGFARNAALALALSAKILPMFACAPVAVGRGAAERLGNA